MQRNVSADEDRVHFKCSRSFLICRIFNRYVFYFLSRVCLFHFRYVGKRNIARYYILLSRGGPSPYSLLQPRQEGSMHTHTGQTQAGRKPARLGLCSAPCRKQSPLILAPCPFPPLQLLHETPRSRCSWLPAQVGSVPRSRLQVRHEARLHRCSLSSSTAVSLALGPSGTGETRVAWSVPLGLSGINQISALEGGQVSILVPHVIL